MAASDAVSPLKLIFPPFGQELVQAFVNLVRFLRSQPGILEEARLAELDKWAVQVTDGREQADRCWIGMAICMLCAFTHSEAVIAAMAAHEDGLVLGFRPDGRIAPGSWLDKAARCLHQELALSSAAPQPLPLVLADLAVGARFVLGAPDLRGSRP